jgi:carbon storage regulator
MLVLSRKPGEKVVIGNAITLTVVAVSGNQVRIGIDAPNHVRILRAELAVLQYNAASSDRPFHPDLEGNPDCAGVLGEGVDQNCSF